MDSQSGLNNIKTIYRGQRPSDEDDYREDLKELFNQAKKSSGDKDFDLKIHLARRWSNLNKGDLGTDQANLAGGGI